VIAQRDQSPPAYSLACVTVDWSHGMVMMPRRNDRRAEPLSADLRSRSVRSHCGRMRCRNAGRTNEKLIMGWAHPRLFAFVVVLARRTRCGRKRERAHVVARGRWRDFVATINAPTRSVCIYYVSGDRAIRRCTWHQPWHFHICENQGPWRATCCGAFDAPRLGDGERGGFNGWCVAPSPALLVPRRWYRDR